MIKIINYCCGLFVFVLSVVVFAFNKKLTQQYSKLISEIDNAVLCNYIVEKQLVFGVVLIEDKRFFKHNGIDLYAICRAINNYFSFGRLEGASTIEQQLVRLITNEREITLFRKIKELFYAVTIARTYTKDEIILTYLNIYQFNIGVKGVLELCHYEKYNFYRLDLKSVCEIAARIKHPTVSGRNYIAYLKRVRKTEILLNRNDFKLLLATSGLSEEFTRQGYIAKPINY